MFDKQKIEDKNLTESSINESADKSVGKQSFQVQDREIIVNSMPEKFRFDRGGHSSAKSAGLLILAGGTILIIASLFALYFFVYKNDSKTVVKNDSSLDKNNQIDQVAQKPSNEQPSLENTESDNQTSLVVEDSLEASTTPQIVEDQMDTQVTRQVEDSDEDGLSDKEELLLGSDPNSVDSDGDGYDDFAELINLYNPAGSGKIFDNPRISEYKNNTFGYSLFYPSEWSVGKVGGDDSIVFTSSDNQFVQVISQLNEEGLSIDDWYNQQQSSIVTIPSSRKISNSLWQGIKSDDGLIVYITDNERKYIFAIAYSSGAGTTVEYKNIFDMMVRGFLVKK